MPGHSRVRKPIEVGTSFGRWTTTAPVDFSGVTGIVPCVCTCGTQRSVRTSSLQQGVSQSCGCLHRERSIAAGLARGKDLGRSRNMYRWRRFLPDTVCSLCSVPFAKATNEGRLHGRELAQVDHLHDACGHSKQSACVNCVRGVVCVRCNRDVAAFDRWGWPEHLLWYRDRRPLTQ